MGLGRLGEENEKWGSQGRDSASNYDRKTQVQFFNLILANIDGNLFFFSKHD